MTDIGFYHLTRNTLVQALPRLLEKVYASGARAVVVTGSAERTGALDTVLWTYDQNAFLPHGTARDGNAEEQPIWITDQDENPNGATILVLTDGAVSGRIGEYARCLEMFDGNDSAAVEQAREHWKSYAAAGHSLTYWQQAPSGRWEEKG